jgi:isopenicillin-N epimerase
LKEKTIGMSDAWSAARAEMMLDPTVANLNTGSFGPLPKVVFEEVTRLRRRLAEEPMDFLLRQIPPLLWNAREQLANFLGADPRRLAFTANVTAAINTVAASLQLAAPGEILLTDHEYGAMHWCWERAAQRQGLTLRTFPLAVSPKTPDEVLDAVRSALTERTRLLFFSHVLSPTGMVLPAKEICAQARRRNIVTVVDGAHSPAMIQLDLDELGCDFYGGNCHKWLLAPTGSGFLYLGVGNEDRLQPLQVSWGWHHDRLRPDDRDEYGSTPRLRAFEFEGIRDTCPWLAVPSAIQFQERLGWQAIRARIAELVGYVRKRLMTVLGLESVTPSHHELNGAMTAFRLPAATDAGFLRAGLWEKHRIEVPIIERPDALLLRVSTHFYNMEEELDRLAEALRQLLTSSR